MTNEEAKAKAGGKTLGERFKAEGRTPGSKGKGRGGRGAAGVIFPTSPPTPADEGACCGHGE